MPFPARFPAGFLTAGIVGLCLSATVSAQESAVEKGAYLVRAAGCLACHTDEANGGEAYAGGRALNTPFGTFYSPNITSDPETGIGAWSDDDFVNALRHGESPDGDNLFPVFPYTSYSGMRRDDMLAIKAYLMSLPPVSKANKDHEAGFPFGFRPFLTVWKWLNFDPVELAEDSNRDAAWNRGRYLVEALAHCGECHTPRNAMGGLDDSLFLAGTADGPDGEKVPNITPHETGIGDWSEGDIVTLLRDGMKPNFDDVQGSMAEAVRDGLSHLTDEDLDAIATYLKAIPPIANAP